MTPVGNSWFRKNVGWLLAFLLFKPVAALVDAELFARVRRMRDRFDALSSRIAEAYANVPAAEGMAEIDAAVARERRHARRR